MKSKYLAEPGHLRRDGELLLHRPSSGPAYDAMMKCNTNRTFDKRMPRVELNWKTKTKRT
jgi:hypothetical protein